MRKHLSPESVIDDMARTLVFKITAATNSPGVGGRGLRYEKVGNVQRKGTGREIKDSGLT